MGYDINDWVSQATASLKLSPVLNSQRAVTEGETDVTSEVLFKGLNVTATKLGYYNGNGWNSYIASDGQFFFKGTDRNYVSWDGTALVIEGIQASFGEPVFDDDKQKYVYRNPIISGGRIKEDSRGNYEALTTDDIEPSNTQSTNIVALGKYRYRTTMEETIRDSINPLDNGILSAFCAYSQFSDENTFTLTINGYAGYFSGISKSSGKFQFHPQTLSTPFFDYSAPIEIRKDTENFSIYTKVSTPTSDYIGILSDYSGSLWKNDTTTWNNIVTNDSNLNVVVKATKYAVNLSKANQFSKTKFHLVLSAADDPQFKLWNASNVQRGSTFTLINAGSTNEVNGFVELEVFNGGILVNCVYSYRKNTVWYHETQNYFIPYTDITKVSFEIVGSATYTSASYAKITNN